MSKTLLLVAVLALASVAIAQVSQQTFTCMFGARVGQRSAAWIPHVNNAMNRFGINTPARIRMFMAQTGHETDGFNTFVEYTNRDGTNAWCGRYEGGCRFRGRGAMQLTHRSNYANAGRALGQDFVNNPDLVAQMPWAFLTAGWFWQTRNLNNFADRGDLVGATRVINGGTNGLADRQNRFAVAQRCIGGAGGNPNPPPPAGGAGGNCQVTVRSGDTLGAIASRHGTTVANIQRLNPAITNPNLIRVGQVIRVC